MSKRFFCFNQQNVTIVIFCIWSVVVKSYFGGLWSKFCVNCRDGKTGGFVISEPALKRRWSCGRVLQF